MNRLFKRSLLALMVCWVASSPVLALSQEVSHLDTDHQAIEGAESADDHHHHHGARANFIPDEILNPDDSVYQAPEEVAEYVGSYQGQVEIPELSSQVRVIVSLAEDGLFNLAYYFVNPPEETGIRFYEAGDGKIHQRDALYQDLVVMTGAVLPAEGGLGSGLIRKTLSPVVLLDQEGQADRLFPYLALAYDLRENYTNARVYQNVGLYFKEGQVIVDVNHLIGLDSSQDHVIALEEMAIDYEDQFLVDQASFELLQESFDQDLVDHNDFRLEFETANDFVQHILAMHLETNASFPEETQVEMIDADKVDLGNGETVQYALMINEQLLYAYDESGQLYLSEEPSQSQGVYQGKNWIVR
ncbi:hypothetical protein ACWOBE_05050 [Hutsoniella sourekii]